MACCARAAPILFLHVSLLLAVVVGAALATAARLKWDPSTYIVLRGVFPTEYRVTTVMLCAASSALIALVHLAGTALSVRRMRVRRVLLFTYAVLMTALICAEVAWAAWMCKRLIDWVMTPSVQHVMTLLNIGSEVMPYLKWFLQLLSRWLPLPSLIHTLIQKVEVDIPINLSVGGIAAALAVVLQLAAVLLALLCACALRKPRAPRGPKSDEALSTTSYFSISEEKPGPLKTVLRKGKLISSSRLSE